MIILYTLVVYKSRGFEKIIHIFLRNKKTRRVPMPAALFFFKQGIHSHAQNLCQ
nr:MAG TPA: hypothetical protein [Caudoviricetes sp.]